VLCSRKIRKPVEIRPWLELHGLPSPKAHLCRYGYSILKNALALIIQENTSKWQGAAAPGAFARFMGSKSFDDETCQI